MTRDRLLALLWPESDAAHARNALNQAIHSLRRDLGADALVEGSFTLRLNPEEITADVAEFEALYDAGSLERAVDLYSGPFLDGFHIKGVPEFERWVEEQRAEASKKAVKGARRLAELAHAQRDFPRAEHWARRALTFDPHDESTLRRLLEILRDAGDSSRAVRTYIEFAQRLRQDLDVDPSAESRALYAQLRVAGVAAPQPAAPAARALDHGTHSEPAAARKKSRGMRILQLAAVAVVVVAGLGTFAVRSWSNRLNSNHVHVLVPAVPRDTNTAQAIRLVQDWILLGLSSTHRFVLSQSVSGESDLSSTARIASLARTAGAGTALTLEVMPTRDSLRFRVTQVDARRGTLEQVVSASAPRGQPQSAAEALRQSVLAGVARLVDTAFARDAATTSSPSSWEAFRLFVAGRDLFIRTGSDEALALLDSAAAADSSFTLPLVWKLYALLARRDAWAADTLQQRLAYRLGDLPPLEAALFEMATHSLRDDSEGAFAAAKRVAALSPASGWNYWAAREAFAAGYPNEAVRLLDQLPADDPWRTYAYGDPYWTTRFWARIHARDFTGLLNDLPRARESSKYVAEMIPTFEARSLAALGRHDEVMAILRSVADGSRASDLSANDIARLVAPYYNAQGKYEHTRSVLDFAISTAAGSDQARRGFDAKSIDWRAPNAYWRRDWPLARVLYDSAGARLATFVQMNRFDVVTVLMGRRGALAARVGDTTAARKLDDWLAQAPDSLKLHRSHLPRFLMARARIAAALGKRDRALELLDEAMRRQWDGTAWTEPDFESLRGDPMFERITRPRG